MIRYLHHSHPLNSRILCLQAENANKLPTRVIILIQTGHKFKRYLVRHILTVRCDWKSFSKIKAHNHCPLSPVSTVVAFVSKLKLKSLLSFTVYTYTVLQIVIVCFLLLQEQFRFFQNLLEDHKIHLVQTVIFGNTIHCQQKVQGRITVMNIKKFKIILEHIHP